MNIPTPAEPTAAIELADTHLRTAVRILYESHGDLDLPEHCLHSIAPERMANQLHALGAGRVRSRRGFTLSRGPF
jgi:hypothetical protein